MKPLIWPKYHLNEFVRTLNGVAKVTHVFRNESTYKDGRRYQLTYLEFKDTVIIHEVNILEVLDIKDYPEFML